MAEVQGVDGLEGAQGAAHLDGVCVNLDAGQRRLAGGQEVGRRHPHRQEEEEEEDGPNRGRARIFKLTSVTRL